VNNKRRLLVAAGAITFATAAVGVLHAPFARPLLMRLGGCPMAGAAQMTSVEMEHARHIALAGERPIALAGERPIALAGERPIALAGERPIALAGERPIALAGERPAESAPSRPALGFTLDTTTLADVHAWAARTHADCDDPHAGLVKCTQVAAASLGLDPAAGAVDELALAFDVQGHLVNETTYRSHLAPAVAARTAQGIVASLATRLGPAGTHAGSFDAAALSRSTAESISTVSYRFADYVADVSSMSIGSSGSIVREHYMSARD
jgi:hypothetical protein